MIAVHMVAGTVCMRIGITLLERYYYHVHGLGRRLKLIGKSSGSKPSEVSKHLSRPKLQNMHIPSEQAKGNTTGGAQHVVAVWCDHVPFNNHRF